MRKLLAKPVRMIKNDEVYFVVSLINKEDIRGYWLYRAVGYPGFEFEGTLDQAKEIAREKGFRGVCIWCEKVGKSVIVKDTDQQFFTFNRVGMYRVINDELQFCCIDESPYDDDNWVVVEDLTELKVWEYNSLVNFLEIHFPEYSIEELKGKFI